MPYTVPILSKKVWILDLYDTEELRYTENWRECHRRGGEMVGEVNTYTKDLVLSAVLQFARGTYTCLRKTRTALVPRVIPTPNTVEAKQGLLAMIMTSLMTMAKPITSNNREEYRKRWKAALAEQNTADKVADTEWADTEWSIMGIAMSFQELLSGRALLRREIVDNVLSTQKHGLEAAALGQVRLVWEYSSLEPIQVMEAFIRSRCRALEIPSVLDQALSLYEQLTAARTTDPNFPYSRVHDANSHPELNHAHYGDLYYAAISFAKANKMLEENFKMSQSHHAQLIDQLIDQYVTKMTANTKKKLEHLGYLVPKQHDEESEDETHEGPSGQLVPAGAGGTSISEN